MFIYNVVYKYVKKVTCFIVFSILQQKFVQFIILIFFVLSGTSRPTIMLAVFFFCQMLSFELKFENQQKGHFSFIFNFAALINNAQVLKRPHI